MASDVIRSSPMLLASLCDVYKVKQRLGVDPVPDLIDAAVAEHQRGAR